MKQWKTIFVLALLFCIVIPAFAIEYRVDFLEPGNPGGWTESLKTFEDAWVLSVGQEIDVDIWLDNIPKENNESKKLLSGGFWIQFDETKLAIPQFTNSKGKEEPYVKIYDGDSDGSQGAATAPCCEGLPGPWDPGSTNQISEPLGPGTYFAALLNLNCLTPDKDSSVILGRIRFRLKSPGNAAITISTIPDFDTVLVCPDAVYDLNIDPITITISQGTGSSTTTPSSTTTEPGSTTTTTGSGSTTTTTGQVSTTTTSASTRWQLVYTQLWAADADKKLTLLRSFRDEMVTHSETGRRYITLLYKHSEEIASLFIRYPLLSMEGGAVIENLLPSIENFMQSNKITVSKSQKDSITLLLDHIKTKASLELQGIINNLINDLQEGRLT